jgi:hypothetical protein
MTRLVPLLLIVGLALTPSICKAEDEADLAAAAVDPPVALHMSNADNTTDSFDPADINPAAAAASALGPSTLGLGQFCSAWTAHADMQAAAVADQTLQLTTARTAGIPFANLSTIIREGQPCGISIGICGKVGGRTD